MNKFKEWCTNGLFLPFAHDPTTGEPSVTLMFYYISFVVDVTAIGITSIIMILKGDYLTATIMPTMLLVTGFVFYRLRHLDKVKFDLDDKQIELSSGDDEEPKKENSNA